MIYSYLLSKSTNSTIATCFAVARAMPAETILQKISKNATTETPGSNSLDEAFAEATAVFAEAMRKASWR